MGNNRFSVLVIPIWKLMFAEFSPHHHYVFQILEWFLIDGSVKIPPNPDFTMRGDSSY